MLVPGQYVQGLSRIVLGDLIFCDHEPPPSRVPFLPDETKAENEMEARRLDERRESSLERRCSGTYGKYWLVACCVIDCLAIFRAENCTKA